MGKLNDDGLDWERLERGRKDLLLAAGNTISSHSQVTRPFPFSSVLILPSVLKLSHRDRWRMNALLIELECTGMCG